MKALLHGGPADGWEEEIERLLAEIVCPQLVVNELGVIALLSNSYTLSHKESEDIAHYQFQHEKT